MLDNVPLTGVFAGVDGTLVLENTSFGMNSTNSASAPTGQVVVNITIDENGWNVAAAPNSGGFTSNPATGLGIASGATDLASIEFFSSLNDSNRIDVGSRNGFWVDNIVVATDQTVQANPFILGDVNLDGSVTFLDIAPFIDLLSNSTFQDEADIDRNGVVNFLDIAGFIAILANP